jgi:hypothetical protein
MYPMNPNLELGAALAKGDVYLSHYRGSLVDKENSTKLGHLVVVLNLNRLNLNQQALDETQSDILVKLGTLSFVVTRL